MVFRLVPPVESSTFGDVWKWAETYHLTERNIGIDAYQIPAEVANLFGDVRYWTEHKTYPPDEIANVAALQAADNHDIGPLLEFARA